MKIFRAWDASEKEMVSHEKLINDPDDFFLGLLTGDHDDGDHLMQWVYLKDRNQKLIFEGDIVNYNSPIDVKRYKTTIPQLQSFHWFGELNGEEDFEIIGNIYELPTM